MHIQTTHARQVTDAPRPVRPDAPSVQQALEEMRLANDLQAIGSERAALHRHQAYGFAWLAAQRPEQRLPREFRSVDLLRTGFVAGLVERFTRARSSVAP